MKNLLLAVVLGLTFLSAPALAQSRPFRLLLGGGNLAQSTTASSYGVSLDLPNKRSQKYVLSLYHDRFDKEQFLPAASPLKSRLSPVFPPVFPAQRFESFSGWGLSLRQPLTQELYAGLGIGRYLTRLRESGSYDVNTYRLGEKVFVGAGKGLFLAELAVTNPGVSRDSQFSLSVGLRL